MKKIIQIEGMSCGHCAQKVQDRLSVIEAIKSIEVDAGQAIIEADVDISLDQVKAALETDDHYKVVSFLDL